MVIFWDQYGILLIEYLSRGTMSSGLSYASIIERLRCSVIVEKRSGKVVLLDDDNAPVDKCNIVQAAIGKRVTSSN